LLVPALPAGAGLFFPVSRPDAFQRGFDGLRVDMPHESADVLNLPAPGAAAPYFMYTFDGGQKFIGQLHGRQLAEGQSDQLFPEALQGPVFILFAGSALAIGIHLAGLPLPYPIKFSFGRRLHPLTPCWSAAPIRLRGRCPIPPRADHGPGFSNAGVDFVREFLHYQDRVASGSAHCGA
jgi:hypothetical protein